MLVTVLFSFKLYLLSAASSNITVLCIIIETLKRENPVACVPKRGIYTRYVTHYSHAFPPPGRDGEHIHSVLTAGNCAVTWRMRKEFVVYVSIGRPDSELLSNSMKVSRGGIIMNLKSHCCDADTYNRKAGHFLWNARVSFIMQSTVYFLWYLSTVVQVEPGQIWRAEEYPTVSCLQ